jgi:DNA polymerase III subunit delta'
VSTLPAPQALPPGNEALRARLLGLFHQDRLHHCMIFEGPPGVGKAASALWLAMAVNCERSGSGAEPCGACWSCRSIQRGQHPDVIQVGLDPEKATPIISVKQARDLLGQLSLHPFHARRRTIIIEPADALNPEAANALLKTLEEPPRATGFVLVTSRPMDLLPTVRSRGQRVRFGAVELERLVPWLQAQQVDQAGELARLGEGCPLRALALAEGGLATWREARDRLVQAISGGTAARLAWSETHARGERAEVSGEIALCLDALQLLMRDVLRRLACRAPADQLYNSDRIELVDAWADRLGLMGLVRLDQAMREAQLDLEANVNPRLAMDALLSRFGAELRPGRAP